MGLKASRPLHGVRSPAFASLVSERRARADRRALNLSPPNGIERRVGPRRASDVAKPACPWCGGGSSRVYRSKGAGSDDRYRRRRRCDDCQRTWPTAEEIDLRRFRRELAKAGVQPSDLGLE